MKTATRYVFDVCARMRANETFKLERCKFCLKTVKFLKLMITISITSMVAFYLPKYVMVILDKEE